MLCVTTKIVEKVCILKKRAILIHVTIKYDIMS